MFLNFILVLKLSQLIEISRKKSKSFPVCPESKLQVQWGSEYRTFEKRNHLITGLFLVRNSSHDLNTKHLNTKQKVCYSSHDLNSGLIVRYSGHESRNL